MRKIDYQTLAEIIRTLRNDALSHALAAPEVGTLETRATCQGEADACNEIARRFAQRASVNREEFLRACGIDPG